MRALDGIQGGLLASWVDPLFLSSIVVGADPRTNGPAPLVKALQRAVPARALECFQELSSEQAEPSNANSGAGAMSILVTSVVFDRSKMQVRCPPDAAGQPTEPKRRESLYAVLLLGSDGTLCTTPGHTLRRV